MRGRRTSLKTLKNAAAKLGVGVEADLSGGRMEITLTAPRHKVFVSSGTHSSVTAQDDPRQARQEIIDGAMSELAEGLETCTIDDCDSCSDD